MDGPEGEAHVWFGAYIMRNLFDWPRYIRRRGFATHPNYRWLHFTAFHSRFMARQLHQKPSRLCFADKMAIALEPQWFYLLRARLSGELEEYMKGSGARTPCQVGAHVRTAREWLTDVQQYTRDYVMTHKDGTIDLWTGTARDLAAHLHEAGEAGEGYKVGPGYEIHTIDAGHCYLLPSLDGDLRERLTFVKRCDLRNPERYPGNLNAYPGTTLQAVMRALIARIEYLQGQIPCGQNRAITFLLRLSIWLLELRAARRHGRGYWHGLTFASRSRMCPLCGHTGCTHVA